MEWNHCGKKNADKLELINERCLRFVFKDFHNTYDKLWLLLTEHLMVTPLWKLRIYLMKETLPKTYVANIFSMSPGFILQIMAYTLSVTQLVNFGSRY